MNWPDHIGEHVMSVGSNGPSYRGPLKQEMSMLELTLSDNHGTN